MRAKLIRSLVLILILPMVAIIFSPSSSISAQCNISGSGIKVEEGLISAPNNLSSFEAAQTGVSCIGDARAVIPQFAITTYSEMKTLYYDQANTSISKTKFEGNQTQSSAQDVISLPQNEEDKLYWITGDLTLEHVFNNEMKKTGVIFINGNLFINKDLKYSSNTAGIAFIVRGEIYVAPTVTEINAFMISYGGFCSAYQGAAPNIGCEDIADINQQKQLTINGSVISLNSTTAPQFVRQKSTQDTAAETINYQPKYLVILKDIFSRDLKIWQEVQ